MLIGNLWSSLKRSASSVQAIYWRSCGVDRWRGAVRGVPRGGIECLPHIWERGECRQQLYPKEGTQLYDPKAGGWRDLGRLDVMQGRLGGNIFGRAGRPHFDKSSEGILIMVSKYDLELGYNGVGAPTRSGKTISAELAMLLIEKNANLKGQGLFPSNVRCFVVVYIAPLKAIVGQRMNDSRKHLVA
ncbi:hypothetical protein SADUNF_Sadunf15G0045900 [Salix dunnii]|uniref:Uncharacterized protein n=1 Tax=Salix dunnii TaxID=1413687 RepID=A0A835JDY2_9ROSI|nr:hypothetical protein SADUNF_Sadunf15G0045900 [Salix dunnii]